jgi:hypothetical protein
LNAFVGLGRERLERRQILAIDQELDFGRIQHFALDQRPGYSFQRLAIAGQNIFRRAVADAHHLFYFFVDLSGGGFGVVAVLRDFAAEEYLLFFLARSLMPHSQTILRASSVARSMSLPAPVDI